MIVWFFGNIEYIIDDDVVTVFMPKSKIISGDKFIDVPSSPSNILEHIHVIHPIFLIINNKAIGKICYVEAGYDYIAFHLCN